MRGLALHFDLANGSTTDLVMISAPMFVAKTPEQFVALLKAVARAHQWSDDHTRRMLQLAFLAPRIMEMIAAGSQPPDLTAEALAERIDLPLLWTAQDQAVGIN